MRLRSSPPAVRWWLSRAHFDGGWRYPAGIVVLFWFLFISLTLILQHSTGWQRSGEAAQSGAFLALVSSWVFGDSGWYLQIATGGYSSANPAVAFFPLYPLMTRLVSVVFAGNMLLAGVVVSWVAALFAGIGLYVLVRRDFTRELARTSLLLLFSFPSAFFLFLPFTEALFLALVVWTFYAARQGHWLLVAPLLLLASLTRIQGLFLALPVAWELGRQWHRGDRTGLRRWFVALIPLLPCGGFLLFHRL